MAKEKHNVIDDMNALNLDNASALTDREQLSLDMKAAGKKTVKRKKAM